jgi:hypothetical protein
MSTEVYMVGLIFRLPTTPANLPCGRQVKNMLLKLRTKTDYLFQYIAFYDSPFNG